MGTHEEHPDLQITIRDLSRKLHVPIASVVKALMNLGVMRTATQPLTGEEVDLVTKLIESAPGDFESGPPI